MHRTILRLSLVCLLSSMAFAADDGGFTPLFNGKDLKGWKFVINGKPGEAGSTFTVKDGAIVISGKPNGYLVTERSIGNSTIKYDWKYVRPEKLEDEEKFTGNSGLLIHIQGLPEKGVWPVCIEIQGQNKNHGAILNVSGAKGGPYKFDAAALKKARKPVGEWNTTETVIMDGAITVKVNGVEVASGKCELKSGPIGFQSEGAELHIKNILVKESK